MSKYNYVLAIDAGGSYFKSCIVDAKGRVVQGSHYKTPVDSGGSADNIYIAYENTIGRAFVFAEKNGLKIDGIGISTPGPFDYANYTSLMKHKFQSIYGVNLKKTLQKRCNLPNDLPIQFIHDAHAFLLGEHWNGAAKGFANAAGVTIGTGLGFGLIKNNKICSNESGGPYISLYKIPWEDGIIEDVVSKRGIIGLYKKLSGQEKDIDVIDIEFLARNGDQSAIDTFAYVGRALGTVLEPIAQETGIECLVLGGQISRAFDFMEAELKKRLPLKKIAMGQNIDNSALIGAANSIFGGF